MSMKEAKEEFKYISEDDYKTLISVYQQKTFELFNQNIALEAKNATLTSLSNDLTKTIEKITKEKQNKPINRKSKTQNNDPLLDEEDSTTFE